MQCKIAWNALTDGVVAGACCSTWCNEAVPGAPGHLPPCPTWQYWYMRWKMGQSPASWLNCFRAADISSCAAQGMGRVGHGAGGGRPRKRRGGGKGLLP